MARGSVGPPPLAIQVSVDRRDLTRIMKTLDKYKDRPLQERERRTIQNALRLLVRPIRDAAPIGKGTPRPGELARSTKVRTLRKRGGASIFGHEAGAEVAAYAVGPTSRIRHLVIRGHRIVTPSGRDLGRRSRANPYVDRAVAPLEGQIHTFIEQQMKVF